VIGTRRKAERARAWLSLLLVVSAAGGCAAPEKPRSETLPPGRRAAEPAEKSSPAAAPDPPPNGSGNGEEGLFLAQIPLDVSERASAWVAQASSDDEFARGLRVRVELTKGRDTLGELSRRSDARGSDGVLRLPTLASLSSQDEPDASHLASSFVVDFDEPPFEALELTARRELEEVTPHGIETFVGAYIESKTTARGFDIASRVAANRAGDCTEHAVLTVALLRRFGFPARVVIGVVLAGLVRDGHAPGMVAWGHAWAEHYADGGWSVVDAALLAPSQGSGAGAQGVPGLPVGVELRRAYLPVTVMKNERLGYARGLVSEASIIHIVRIGVDRAE
jgi:hypothetical protein